MNIDEILAERGKTHGDFKSHAKTAQQLKFTLREQSKDWQVDFSHTQQEALEMICHKIARIVAGNPNFADHWRDIAGYATLVVDELETQDEKD